jgi:alpha-ketoglutarate-dependent taurine dioxygenase
MTFTWFKNNAEELGLKKLRAERGAPENYGEDNLVNVHPLIRTNPVTGWKGLFIANGYIYLMARFNN